MSNPDEQIRCPHCGTLLNLPAQLYVLREAHRVKGSYVAFGDAHQRLPCPHCGRTLLVSDILAGKHDVKPAGVIATVFGLALLVALAFGLVALCSR